MKPFTKKLFVLFLITIFNLNLSSHSIDSDIIKLREWTLNSKTLIKASFLMIKNDCVYLQNENNVLMHYPYNSFSSIDQQYLKNKYQTIKNLNSKILSSKDLNNTNSFNPTKISFIFILFIFILVFTILLARKTKFKLMVCFISTAFFSVLYSFRSNSIQLISYSTNPSKIDSAFKPFKPFINTFWNATYFYIESNGIPTTHTMMVGIASNGWQQQVPLPICYTGSNSWAIPLHPVISATPIPVNASHFKRGAIAVAVNGISIFNPYTNTGVDAFLDGQLDNFGGHCGRSDDYHYHTAPLHLYSVVSQTMPIAYALDGFAIYGAYEPNGSNMLTLDPNHGHFASDGVYHYHGTVSAPYMIANMAGQVTEDATYQIIPQPSAQPVRPSLTPLSGALIISCNPNTNKNGYNVTYTKGGATDSVVYNWTPTGTYTFKYYTAVLDSTRIYNKSAPCITPFAIGFNNNFIEENEIIIYPNPSSDYLFIKFSNSLIQQKDILSLSIINTLGKTVMNFNSYQEKIKIDHLSKGIYFLKIATKKNTISRKITIE